MTVHFTNIACGHGPLTKEFFLAEDGSIQKSVAAQLYRGRYSTVTAADLQDFAKHLEGATPAVAFTYGVPDQSCGDLVREEDLANYPHAIARTRNYFGWRKSPGILMLDNDIGTASGLSLDRELWKSCGVLAAVLCGYKLIRERNSPNCRFRKI